MTEANDPAGTHSSALQNKIQTSADQQIEKSITLPCIGCIFTSDLTAVQPQQDYRRPLLILHIVRVGQKKQFQKSLSKEAQARVR